MPFSTKLLTNVWKWNHKKAVKATTVFYLKFWDSNFANKIIHFNEKVKFIAKNLKTKIFTTNS